MIVRAVANIFGSNCEMVCILWKVAHSVIQIENPSITDEAGSPDKHGHKGADEGL